LIELQIELAQIWKMAKKIKMPARSAVDIELNIGALAQEFPGPAQIFLGQGLAELHDFAFGLERTKRIAETRDRSRVEGEEAAVVQPGDRNVHVALLLSMI
jgi:hypothetical protein